MAWKAFAEEDDARLDVDQLVAKALREFERPHVRMLDLWRSDTPYRNGRARTRMVRCSRAQFLSENGWPSSEGSTR